MWTSLDCRRQQAKPYSTGEIWIKSQYKNGKLEGNREVYFEGGKLEKTELYKNGFKVGKPHH